MIDKYRIIFKGIVGSQSYNLHTETSDADIKGVFIQPNSDILSNKYIPQIEVDSDTVYYELRRFLELVSVGNPNVLELLYLPSHCNLIETKEWLEIKKVRKEFLSKKCYDTFSGYARTQLSKASGLNKKFNWEKSRTQRKNILDFCKVLDRENGEVASIKDWLSTNGYKESQIGLSSMDGFRDCFRLYVDHIKWAADNHRFENVDFSDRGYRGIGDINTNEPRCSVIEKYRRNDWKCILYFNREHYSSHCKDYKLYQKWLKDRNEDRVSTNKKHGQDFDGKNILHTVRLIMTAKEIPLEHKINVDRTNERDFLLSIKRGEVDLKEVISVWSKESDNLKQLYENSNLKDGVSIDFINDLELKIRKNEL